MKILLLKTCIFLLVSFYACQSIARGPGEEKADSARVLDSLEMVKYRADFTWFFDSLLNSSRFSGGILVAKNGQVIYEHYQGNAFGDSSSPISSRTPFHVASTSKTFTSTAVLQLESRGLLNLDDSLNKYWPDFPYGGITIRNLLNHSSGLPDYAYFLPKYGWDRKITVTNWDILNTLVTKMPSLDFKTGSRFKYCNTNFVLLALLVEKQSGLSFPFYVKENIFNVAGMKDSYVLSPYTKADYMPSWTEGGRVYTFDYLDGVYGDKNVFTTCRDLLKFDSAIRNGVLLDPAVYEKALEPSFRDTKYRDPWEYYGLGWRIKIFDNNVKIPYHNGWWHGNNAVFQRIIADTAVIIVMGNRMNKRIYASAKGANFFRTYYPDGVKSLMGDETDLGNMEAAEEGTPPEKEKVPFAGLPDVRQKTAPPSQKSPPKP